MGQLVLDNAPIRNGLFPNGSGNFHKSLFQHDKKFIQAFKEHRLKTGRGRSCTLIAARYIGQCSISFLTLANIPIYI